MEEKKRKYRVPEVGDPVQYVQRVGPVEVLRPAAVTHVRNSAEEDYVVCNMAVWDSHANRWDQYADVPHATFFETARPMGGYAWRWPAHVQQAWEASHVPVADNAKCRCRGPNFVEPTDHDELLKLTAGRGWYEAPAHDNSEEDEVYACRACNIFKTDEEADAVASGNDHIVATDDKGLAPKEPIRPRERPGITTTFEAALAAVRNGPIVTSAPTPEGMPHSGDKVLVLGSDGRPAFEGTVTTAGLMGVLVRKDGESDAVARSYPHASVQLLVGAPTTHDHPKEPDPVPPAAIDDEAEDPPDGPQWPNVGDLVVCFDMEAEVLEVGDGYMADQRKLRFNVPSVDYDGWYKVSAMRRMDEPRNGADEGGRYGTAPDKVLAGLPLAVVFADDEDLDRLFDGALVTLRNAPGYMTGMALDVTETTAKCHFSVPYADRTGTYKHSEVLVTADFPKQVVDVGTRVLVLVLGDEPCVGVVTKLVGEAYDVCCAGAANMYNLRRDEIIPLRTKGIP